MSERPKIEAISTQRMLDIETWWRSAGLIVKYIEVPEGEVVDEDSSTDSTDSQQASSGQDKKDEK